MYGALSDLSEPPMMERAEALRVLGRVDLAPSETFPGGCPLPSRDPRAHPIV